MASKLKVLEQETPAPAEPSMAELREARTDRIDALFDEVETVRFQMQFAQGDALLPLYETEARLVRAINHEPQRCSVAWGRWKMAEAIESLRNGEALRAQAAAHSARADEFAKVASNITDVDERDCETAKAAVFQRKVQVALAQAAAADRDNILHEPVQRHEKRLAELDAELGKLRRDLEWQRQHAHERMEDSGRSGVGADFARRTEGVITDLEAQIAETQTALEAEQSKKVSLNDPTTWPDSIKNEVHQTANAVAERIARRAARIRGKF